MLRYAMYLLGAYVALYLLPIPSSQTQMGQVIIVGTLLTAGMIAALMGARGRI